MKLVRFPRRLTLEILERVTADAVMINLALLTAFTLRFLSVFVFGAGEEGATLQTYSGVFWEFLWAYLSLSWLLTLICLIVFYLSGFYTHGRTYRSRYKALIIAQAVSLSYLLFGFLTYFIQDLAPFPRSVLLLGWLLTLVLVGGLRVWATLWEATVWAEARVFGRPEKSKVRKKPFLIHIDPRHLLLLNVTGRYCPACDLIILHKDIVEDLMARTFERYDSSVIGNGYLIIGTVEQAYWRKYKGQATTGPVLDNLHDFEDVVIYEPMRPRWLPDESKGETNET